MITIKMAMTIATIGRLMKNLYMAGSPNVPENSLLDLRAEFVGRRRLIRFRPSNGFGFTTAPSFAFCVPSTTTRSPGFRPLSMIQSEPICSPTLTACRCAVFVFAHDRDLIGALKFSHGALRHDQRVRHEFAFARGRGRIGRDAA